MGRVASAGDNAAVESFWALLQRNVLNGQQWQTRDDLHHAIVHWIEYTYNRHRRQRRLGKLTPVEYKLAFTRNNVQAAAQTTQPVSTKPPANPPTYACGHREP